MSSHYTSSSTPPRSGYAPFAITNEVQRFTAFISGLMTERLGCNFPADEDLFRAYYGERGSFAFWESYTFGTTSLPLLVQHIALLRAETWDRIDPLEMAAKKFFMDAFIAGESFFKAGCDQLSGLDYYHQIPKPDLVKVLTRPALEWFVANPASRHLSPFGLQGFLKGELPAKPQPTHCSQDDVNAWVLARFEAAKAGGLPTPKIDLEVVPMCLNHFAQHPPTIRQIKAAIKALPGGLARKRGISS